MKESLERRPFLFLARRGRVAAAFEETVERVVASVERVAERARELKVQSLARAPAPKVSHKVPKPINAPPEREREEGINREPLSRVGL